MYCQNCGKQLPNNARFCSECGKNIGNTGTTGAVNSDVGQQTRYMTQKFINGTGEKIKCIVFMVISMVASFIVIISGIRKILQVDFFLYSEEVSMFQIWKILELFKEYKIEVGLYKVFIAIATICYLICVVCGILFYYQIMQKEYVEKIVTTGKISMFFGTLVALIIWGMVQFFNSSNELDFYGMEVFHCTNTLYLMFGSSILNGLLFLRLYEWTDRKAIQTESYDLSWDSGKTTGTIFKDKGAEESLGKESQCPYCGKRYRGKHCPGCSNEWDL